jgi:hypothetical protein
MGESKEREISMKGNGGGNDPGDQKNPVRDRS